MPVTSGVQDDAPTPSDIKVPLTPDVTLFFSASTALSIVSGLEPSRLFAVIEPHTKNTPPHNIKCIQADIHKYIYDTTHSTFEIERILINSSTREILGSETALRDIQDKTITPPENIHALIQQNPIIILEAAYIEAYTTFTHNEETYKASRMYAHKLHDADKRSIWKWMSILLCSPIPSRGVEFLRKTGALEFILPELHRCVGVSQNKKYHKYTVYQHCLKACDHAPPEITLRLAALLHDIGKALVYKETDTGITFHKHEVESSKLVYQIMKRWGVPYTTASNVIHLVSMHMYHYDRVWKDSTVLRFARKARIGPEFIGRMDQVPLFKLRQCDRAGRDLEPVTQKQIDLEKRLEQLLRKK